MRIERRLTTDESGPYRDIVFTTISIEICDQDPNKCLCIPNFEVPAHWSREACEHLAYRYVRRTGVPHLTIGVEEEGVPKWLERQIADEAALTALPKRERSGSEASAKQLFHRLAGAWTYWGWRHGYFDTQQDARRFYEEICYLMASQRAMPASPQWEQTGLHWAYGIAGDAQGHYYVDAQNGELFESQNAYERPQHHHCFIQSVKDELSSEGGIADLWQREMRVFRHGSGSGCNMSNIRGAAETLSSGMPPAGLIPFMEIGEKAAQAMTQDHIASQLNRLVLVDVDHPDIADVLSWRVAQHEAMIANQIGDRQIQLLKSQILRAVTDFCGPIVDRFDPKSNLNLGDAMAVAHEMALPTHQIEQIINEVKAWQGQAQSFAKPRQAVRSAVTVSQLGIRLSNDFVAAAQAKKPWPLTSRLRRDTALTIQADALFDHISHMSWLTRDGVIQFHDNIQFWHGCREAGAIEASSPNSEFLFLSDTACDVAQINLTRYVTDDGQFDSATFEHTVRLQVMMCDISITMAQFPSAEVAYNSYRYRPIGLSFCNLSAMLMRMGYAYHSGEARAIAGAIAALMTGKAYQVSAEIARELGGFEAFSEHREAMMRLMYQHHEAAFGRSEQLGSPDSEPMVIDHSLLPDTALSDAVQRVWDQALIQGDDFGYSNAQVSLVAASPNVMILMDAASAGCLPVTDYATSRQPGDWIGEIECALVQLGYRESQISDIKHYVTGHHSCVDAPYINHMTLRAKGFDDRQLYLIQEALPQFHSLRELFDPLLFGERFSRNVLKLNDRQLYDADFDLLSHLGFSAEQIEAANAYCFGHQHFRDAPHLRDEDVAVFAVAQDSANTIEAQLSMMAAIQPYLSGGIAHAITTPYDATIADYQQWILTAWKLGLKSIQLQRASEPIAEMILPQPDMSEPVYGQEENAEIHLTEHAPSPVMKSFHRPRTSASHQRDSVEAKARIWQGNAARAPLPARRRGYTQKVSVDGQTIFLRTGEYDDGRLGEIFIDMPKASSDYRLLMNQFAIAISVSLQHGVPLQALYDSFVKSRFDPAGQIMGHSHIETATSVLDYIFRDLALSYLNAELSPDDALTEALAANLADAYVSV